MKRLVAILICLMTVTTFAFAEGSTFTLTAPSGAPAIAAARLAENDPDHYRFIAADTIAAEFSKNEADFIIAPINAGAKLFKAGKSSYILGAVITRGNLVFASQREGFTMNDINGAKITLFGENTIHASIALYVLEKKGIVPESIEYLAGAAETQAALLNGEADIVMTAEPAITAAKMKDETIASFALNDLYKEITGFDGFTQAGLFVSASTAQDKPELIKTGLEKIRVSVEMCQSDPEKVAKNAVAMEILPKEQIVMKALPGCSIRWMDASEAREQIEYAAKIDLSQYGGELPADDFYFTAE